MTETMVRDVIRFAAQGSCCVDKADLRNALPKQILSVPLIGEAPFILPERYLAGII